MLDLQHDRHHGPKLIFECSDPRFQILGLTETHDYAQYVRMAAIDHKGLTKAMDLALVTPKQLAEATGMSLTYVCDITAGRRTLKRNPELRKKIAVALNVPQHWIEHAEPVAS